MENSQRIQPPLFSSRVLPTMMAIMGIFHLADWVYLDLGDTESLMSGIGFLFMGTSLFAAHRPRIIAAGPFVKTAMLAAGWFGFMLAVWPLLQRWL